MLTHISPQIIINGTLYTLLVFSVITWTLIFFKLWQFINNSRCNERFEKAFWNLPELQQVKKLSPDLAKGSQARLAYEGVTWLDEHQRLAGTKLQHCGDSAELLEQALRVQLQQEQHSMEGGLTLLASIGSTAPFVGLFGTVLGIMHAMHEITASGSTSLDVVAGPIGDALVATAIGIAVAVPAVLAYNFLLRRVKIQRTRLENFVASFLSVALNTKNEQA
ncbi:MotA/TolQ/ExbB proton channel family protein [Methylobacter sp. S3L5C]|uniref:MotA/TolQ/ExbB proton channel family protein n=1 Tax=Methylobacter sp. S3L5C TaxID=2839024 RepID=UPI001FAE550F|nr:MotA/TolQ/ExbB proton channel family protein [Methylobacter sp. S3L5C]UOA09677.1 MotA/TolQ/ExbB proton channel family protein [Methylobacter sp. S3L5C]